MGQQAPRVIWLHSAAPRKPALGAPCNGCGVCCTVEPCPVAMAFLRQRHGACEALQWNEPGQLYRCGMAEHPERHLKWLPMWAAPVLRRLVLRWIAASTVCDAADECEEG